MITENLFALDLGTTKFCLATLESEHKKSPPTIKTLSVKAKGMRRGMLSDFAEAKRSLQQLITIGEREFKNPVTEVVVGIAGSHLKGETNISQLALSADTTVDRSVLNNLKKVSELKTPLNSEHGVLQSIPINYQLDERDPVDNPIGLSGSVISGKFFTIKGDKFYLKDVIRLCNECGLKVLRLYAEPVASASVILDDELKMTGTTMADIGGGTTDGIIFKGGKPVKIFTVNIGGKLMTSDLSIGLGISYDEAEEIKIKLGLNPNYEDLKNIENKWSENPDFIKKVTTILGPRILELGHMIEEQIKRSLLSQGGELS